MLDLMRYLARDVTRAHCCAVLALAIAYCGIFALQTLACQCTKLQTSTHHGEQKQVTELDSRVSITQSIIT